MNTIDNVRWYKCDVIKPAIQRYKKCNFIAVSVQGFTTAFFVCLFPFHPNISVKIKIYILCFSIFMNFTLKSIPICICAGGCAENNINAILCNCMLGLACSNDIYMFLHSIHKSVSRVWEKVILWLYMRLRLQRWMWLRRCRQKQDEWLMLFAALIYEWPGGCSFRGLCMMRAFTEQCK